MSELVLPHQLNSAQLRSILGDDDINVLDLVFFGKINTLGTLEIIAKHQPLEIDAFAYSITTVQPDYSNNIPLANKTFGEAAGHTGPLNKQYHFEFLDLDDLLKSTPYILETDSTSGHNKVLNCSLK